MNTIKKPCYCFFFFLNDPATPKIYTLPLPDALPILPVAQEARTDHAHQDEDGDAEQRRREGGGKQVRHLDAGGGERDDVVDAAAQPADAGDELAEIGRAHV